MREKLTKSDNRYTYRRKELIEAVKEARSHGDLSEILNTMRLKRKKTE